ncbi:MAG: hypothetical protein MGG37_16390, partial [Trichodesmium sp. MAG_R01]|nr:hypothetical protein [Trichodesmium sp. MAG_R01]
SSVLMSFVMTTQRAFHNRFNYRWDNIHLTIPTLYALHYQKVYISSSCLITESFLIIIGHDFGRQPIH